MKEICKCGKIFNEDYFVTKTKGYWLKINYCPFCGEQLTDDLEIIRTEIEPKLKEIKKELEITPDELEKMYKMSLKLGCLYIDDFIDTR